MTIAEKYYKIYADEIATKSSGIIIKYSPVTNQHMFCPFSHAAGTSSVEDLAQIMRKNLLFYCYGEEEVVKHYERSSFLDLEQAAQYAFQSRLPVRPLNSDGLPSEVLLDLLVQLYTPNAYKLAVRPLFRQQDNNEIKGYDLTYFTASEQSVELWLGQAKLGEKGYCKQGIHSDLLSKFKDNYLCRQMFFVCDKPVGASPEADKLTTIINCVNLATLNQNDAARQQALLNCFQENNISIIIPCLMAYGAGSVYSNINEILEKVEAETAEIQKYFLKNKYDFLGFYPKILFYIFPIEDIERLRDTKRGFYRGLRT